MEKPSVFVTYANDKYDMKEKVLSLVAFLRQNGIPAACDETMLDEGMSNFIQIMEKGLSYDKVIVVLSEEYKNRIEANHGGVVKEFNYIADDIQKNPQKYILVTFSKTRELENIMPSMFAGFLVIDLVKDSHDNYNTLYARILNKGIWDVPETSDTTYQVTQKKIKEIGDVLTTNQGDTTTDPSSE